MFPKNELKREQVRAIDAVEQALPEIKNLTKVTIPELSFITREDAKCFLYEKISTSDLPREEWVWNQSRGRTSVTDITGNVNLSFYKLSPRYTRTNVSLHPKFKLWVYNLTIQPNNKEISFLWCEKGNKLDTPPNSPPQDLDLNIEDFGFLAPFISEETAKEFGWIRYDD